MLSFLYQNVFRAFVWILLKTKYHTIFSKLRLQHTRTPVSRTSRLRGGIALTNQDTSSSEMTHMIHVVYAAMQVQCKYITKMQGKFFLKGR